MPRVAVFTNPAPRGALLALCLIAGAGPASASLSFEEGLARDPDDDRLLYREQHLVRRDGDRPVERLVLYRCADGTAFARKHVDYRESTVAPAFRFEDARFGYGEGLRRTGGEDRVWVRSGGTGERSAALPRADLVADAGFDEFVRGKWPRLLEGDAVPLRFAVPARLESLAFTVRRKGAARLGDEAAEVFRLRLGGWLGWIAPHIDVAYDADTRRLLRFEGISNLREDDGRSQLVARIDFPTAARPAPESRWTALRAQPLSGCRVRG